MIKCEECKYCCRKPHPYPEVYCEICRYSRKFCCIDIMSDAEIEHMDICYNCEYWIGCGDWGLSCEKDYYKCSINGFDKACEQFKRKQ